MDLFKTATGHDLDIVGAAFSMVRTPGEPDASMRARLLVALRYHPHGLPTPTLQLWLLLARLGLRSIPRDVFPIGLAI